MHMRFVILPFMVFSASMVTPAAAQDRASHFDGLYFGGSIGAAVQNNDRGDRLAFDTDGDGVYDDNVLTVAGANAFSPGFCNGNANSNNSTSGCLNDDDAIEYSIRVGLDGRERNIVGGLLLEVTKHNATDSTSGFSTTPASYTVTRGLDYSLAARGRVGFTPGGGALFYVTGGAIYGKLDHEFFSTNTANAFAETDDGEWQLGGQVGGGAEVMLTDNLSLGLEYLYTKLDDDKYAVEVTRGSAPATNPFILNGGSTSFRPSDHVFDFHSFKATMGVRF